MRHLNRALLLALAVPLALSAQTPEYSGLTSGAGTGGGTGGFAPSEIPAEYDVLISVSDRTINRLANAILAKQETKPGQDQRLNRIQVEFTANNEMRLQGGFQVRASEYTMAGDFGFDVTSKLSSGPMNQIDLAIDGASITESGKPFLPRLEAQHVAGQLRFFSPGIERAGDQAIAKLHENLHKGMDPDEQKNEINDLFSVVNNSLRLRILPRVLSPLLPPVKILFAGIQNRKLQIYAEF